MQEMAEALADAQGAMAESGIDVARPCEARLQRWQGE